MQIGNRRRIVRICVAYHIPPRPPDAILVPDTEGMGSPMYWSRIFTAVVAMALWSQSDGRALAEGPPTVPADMFGTLESRFPGQRLRPHPGVDYWVPEGTPILAVADGRIERVGYDRNGGVFVVLRHTDDVVTSYVHLSKVHYGPPMRVKRGQVIAASGQSGRRAGGPHLHFTVRVAGKPVDPYKGYWYPDGDTPLCFRPDHDYPDDPLAFTHPIQCNPD